MPTISEMSVIGNCPGVVSFRCVKGKFEISCKVGRMKTHPFNSLRLLKGCPQDTDDITLMIHIATSLRLTATQRVQLTTHLHKRKERRLSYPKCLDQEHTGEVQNRLGVQI
jgi:hypothetical protein